MLERNFVSTTLRRQKAYCQSSRIGVDDQCSCTPCEISACVESICAKNFVTGSQERQIV